MAHDQHCLPLALVHQMVLHKNQTTAVTTRDPSVVQCWQDDDREQGPRSGMMWCCGPSTAVAQKTHRNQSRLRSDESRGDP